MIALTFAFALFLSFGVVGIAVLALLAPRRNRLHLMLLAPVVGLAATVLPLFTLSRAGLGIGSFAVALEVGLLLASAVVLWRARVVPLLPWRRYALVLGVLVLILVEVGRPALRYGFDWVSYANNDMATEVLYASHLVTAGFSDAPDSSALFEGRDYTQMGWIAHHVRDERPAARMVLAWLSSLTGLTIHQVYMPLILALHLTMASTAAALVTHTRRTLWAPILTAALVGLSSLTTSATLNQLLGQTGGISLLAGATAVFISPFERRWRNAVRHGVLFGLVAAILFLWYPESMPFLVVGAGLFTAISLVRRRLRLVPFMQIAVAAVLSGAIFLNTYLPVAITFMISQTSGSHALGDDELAAQLRTMFPHYLMPRGLANLWGMQVIGAAPISEPFESGSIALGALILAAAVTSAAVLAWRRHPAGTMALTMMLVCVPLIVQRSGFGLYKLAMFLQPFMLASLVVAWLSFVRMRPRRLPRLTLARFRPLRPALAWQVAPLVLLGLLGSPSHLTYVSQSYGHSTATHMPGASENRIVDQFRSALASAPPGPIMLDTMQIVLANFQVVYTVGMPTEFPSSFSFFTTIYRLCTTDDPMVNEANAMISTTRAKQIQTVACSPGYDSAFSMLDSAVSPTLDAFKINWIGRPTNDDRCPTLIAVSGRQTVFNSRTNDQNDPPFKTYPCNAENHLIFVSSEKSQHYHGARGEIGVFAIEPEPLWRDGMMLGIGRYLLFQIVRPTEAPRLMIDLTASYKGDGENALPPAAGIGTTREPFPIMGRGSARVFSPPLSPQVISGDPYVSIDMGVEGQYFPERRTGLARLYGSDLRVDPRRMTGFTRGVALVSEEEYQQLKPPSIITNFQKDLANPDLEYSGIYEDGWVSEASFYGLSQSTDRSAVVVRGSVPMIGDPDYITDARLLVDGVEIAHQKLRPGSFELRGRAPVGEGRRRVELYFDRVQRLIDPDSRPIAAVLETVGFEPLGVAASPVAVTTESFAQSDPALISSGVYPDGWMYEKVTLDLTQRSPSAEVVIRGLLPEIAGPSFTTDLTVLVDGREAARKTLKPGDFEMRAPAPPGTGERHLELRFSNAQALPAPDRRQVGALLQSIGFEARATAPGAAPVAAPAAPPVAATPVAAAPPAVSAMAVSLQSGAIAPPAITDPTNDLGNPAIQAVGLDGDGWLAGMSAFTLTPPAAPASLVVRGMVPMVTDPSYTADLTVLVDGQEAARRTLGLGNFELRAPAPAGGNAQQRVELRFSATQQLPAPDTRQAGARISFIGFEAGTADTQAQAAPIATPVPTPSGPAPLRAVTDPTNDLGNPTLQATGLDGDGWVAGTSSFTLAQPSPTSWLVVRAMIPLINDPAYTSEMVVLVDGQEVTRATFSPGDLTVKKTIPVGSAGQHRVELRFSNTQQLPAPDTRQVGARISFVGFEEN